MNPYPRTGHRAVSKAGAIPADEICAHTNHQMKYLKRDLQLAVDAGILDPDDSDKPVAVYHYREPSDPTARSLISLLV